MKHKIPFKIELTGQAQTKNGDHEEQILLLIKVLRTLGRDLGIIINHPAIIHLDDTLPATGETKT